MRADRRYKLVRVPEGYPHPWRVLPDGTRLAFYHRVVMERAIGRYLTVGEVVHHIDGDPTNNAIGNLRLYASQAEHLADAHPGTAARTAAATMTLPF